ncbi:MAG: hypothetical protein R6U89_00565 [Dehalococcoidia bacterium]
MAKRTGIFFLPTAGQRLRDFPGALGSLLSQPNVSYYEAYYEIDPTPRELLLKVHSERMIDEVRRDSVYEAALYSTGGTVMASELIRRREIDNAFVFTGTGDHHAGRDYFGGGCHLNGAALAIQNLRDRFGMRRFAILDTDSHHGDGTRDIFACDDDVLHVCLCDCSTDSGTNVDIKVPFRTTDDLYLQQLETEFVPRVEAFVPEMVLWEFGYDTTRGDYGDRGLSPDCHARMASIVKGVADRVCGRRLVTILCGGSRRDIAAYCIPEIIRRMAEVNEEV